jgi:hypothetical protein
MTEDHLSAITHIVVLMLENRSFDHTLGFLYADRGNVSPAGHAFEGLSGSILAGTVASDIMFTPDMLPVLSGLARGYAVCDGAPALTLLVPRAFRRPIPANSCAWSLT